MSLFPGLLLLFFSLIYSYLSIQKINTLPKSHLNITLVQANIGSLEHLGARFGFREKMRSLVERYIFLTEKSLKEKKPDLIIWPETAIPTYLDGSAFFGNIILDKIHKEWKVPVLTGSYFRDSQRLGKDFNSALLIIPQSSKYYVQTYHKNKLLAFGEYLPFGRTFPKIYEWFPQVADFSLGHVQPSLHLSTKNIPLKISICFEAIVPQFIRQSFITDNAPIHINMTNDSWFGDTSEPLQHAALSQFRAIEHRKPMIRITNTGLSLHYSVTGQPSLKKMGVNEEGYLNDTIEYLSSHYQTVYEKYGDFSLYLFFLIVIIGFIHASYTFRNKFF